VSPGEIEARADVRLLLELVEKRTRFRHEHTEHAKILDKIRERWLGPTKNASVAREARS
jgi:hypothetical protein